MITQPKTNENALNDCKARQDIMFRMSLRTIMNRHGTDKLFVHHYDAEYQRHFDPLREQPLILLEIGIGGDENPKRGGASLKVWRDYFPFAVVHGLDIHPKRLILGSRVKIWTGDQNDAEYLTRLIEKTGVPDIIIDDGSHQQAHIFTSFTTLFPLLKPGGIYVIEDLATAYQPRYGGSPDAPPTIGLIQRLVDGLHWTMWSGRGPKPIDQLVKSVHVSKELVFIYKY